MSKDDFVLSDKIWGVQKFEKIDWKKRTKILFANDVKEFIKRLKEVIENHTSYFEKEGVLENFYASDIDFLEEIDKLAGDNLK